MSHSLKYRRLMPTRRVHAYGLRAGSTGRMRWRWMAVLSTPEGEFRAGGDSKAEARRAAWRLRSQATR
jgi:hypothetical protein